MVTHGGRCPRCSSRTTPGVGSRAGFWICVPCQAIFDNYGQERPLNGSSSQPEPFIPKVVNRRSGIISLASGYSRSV